MTSRPRTTRWQPPETEDEREQRESYVTPKRARQIRHDIDLTCQAQQLGPAPDPMAPLPVRCGRCGIGPADDCYLPARLCKRPTRPPHPV